jgi:hypothetical protein
MRDIKSEQVREKAKAEFDALTFEGLRDEVKGQGVAKTNATIHLADYTGAAMANGIEQETAIKAMLYVCLIGLAAVRDKATEHTLN